MEAELDGIDYRVLVVPEPVIDLEAYRWAVDRCESRHMLFLNSYSQLLCDDWLRIMASPFDYPRTGLVGATGTYESIKSSAPPLLRLRWQFRFPGFPNPHLRSTGFMLERELIEDLDWHTPVTKADAYDLENGKHSISHQVEARGLKCVVAGRDGRAYAAPDWRASKTFRSGEQANLIVADNRTDEYLAADREQRAYLERLAWGE